MNEFIEPGAGADEVDRLAGGELDGTDFALLSELAGLYEVVDPPPAGLTERVQFSLTLAGLHAEIAYLHQQEPLAVRGDANDENSVSLTFSGNRHSLTVTVTPDERERESDGDPGLRVDAWVTGGGTTVALVSHGEHTPIVSDDHGRLLWRHVRTGPVQFVIRPDDPEGKPTITPVVEF